ncbi:hypothetical protein SAMN06296273_2579 [Nitrosomonas ureae]|uniref:Uncharacterized protein n=1 Tax=Nitrosomonas ureae TaxID=44577 RepID=A0A285C0P2_9PROT|nr:hypothetical protein SAMN06296273_2579 [Nitrosomonas ureae]
MFSIVAVLDIQIQIIPDNRACSFFTLKETFHVV